MVGATFTVAAAAEVLRSKKGITAVGNAQVDTAQSKFGGASFLGDGTGDYLQLPTDSSLTLAADFTVEMWYRIPGSVPAILPFYNSDHLFYLTNDGGTAKYAIFQGGTNRLLSSGITVSANTWYHVAYVRSGSTITAYHNGTSAGTATWAGTISGTTPTIGEYASSYFINGHYDEMRVSNSARYTTTFTPSTTPFVNDANTLLLIHANGTDASTFFEDDNGSGRSQNAFSLIGNAQVSTTRSKFGGSSAYFDGTGDYAIAANSITFADNQNFTWEFWVNEDVSQGCKYIGGQIQNDIFIGHDPNAFSNRLGVGVVSVGWYIDFGETLALDTWYHLCVQRSGDTVYGYINGVLKVTHTGTLANWDWHWRNVVLGAETTGNTPFNGYLDEMRWSNTVRYATAGFTQPTAPFVNDANTVLLIHADGTNASTVIRDDNGVRSQAGISALGNAQVDTAQSKFGGASLLLDGTGDALSTAGIAFGTGDFTVEYWIRPTAQSSYDIHWDLRGTPTSNLSPIVYTLNGTLYVDVGATTVITGSALSNNTWYHIALARSGSSTKLFVNGTQSGSTYTDSNNYVSAATLYIGELYSLGGNGVVGNMDEFRISNSARYTTTFTAPTAPFQNDANTLLLLHMDGTDASTVFTDDNGVTPTHSYT
jgi:hypothetical protein